jgi:lambda repressor-like predicted transcriptional regulator
MVRPARLKSNQWPPVVVVAAAKAEAGWVVTLADLAALVALALTELAAALTRPLRLDDLVPAEVLAALAAGGAGVVITLAAAGVGVVVQAQLSPSHAQASPDLALP